ncbi:MAG: glutamine--fructose-6-phosphate transaminase (isomerizing) [bacterium]
MCGIVGAIGKMDTLPFLLEGLGRLEYRGYDSAGVAVLNGNEVQTRKALGGVARLVQEVAENPLKGSPGISHTRWATHGAVTPENAHPHLDASGRLALVHNGVVENHKHLREELAGRGHIFRSQTDTEVLAHLIGEVFDQSAERNRSALIHAMQETLRHVRGTYAIAIIHADLGPFLAAARSGSPLVLGIGKEAGFIASDAAALDGWVEDLIYLKDQDIAALDGETFHLATVSGNTAGAPKLRKIEVEARSNGKGRFPHHMLKEIHEQPDTLREGMKGRLCQDQATVRFTGLHRSNEQLREVKRIILTGCGTTFHAALAGEYLIEGIAQLPVECDYASEFRYRNAPLDAETAVFAMSQSGETADTLAALRESKRKGALTLGICNNVFSTISRESDGGIGLRAGVEIGVAATKTFTSELLILAMLGLLLGRIRNLSQTDAAKIIEGLENLPSLVARTLERESQITEIATKYAKTRNFLFMGRQSNFPIALEGALKMKEITYIPASGHPSAELKHGIIALINEETPTVVLAPQDEVFEKNVSNIEEIKARRGPVIAIGTQGDNTLTSLCDETILLPETTSYLNPFLNTVALQLLAYHTAVVLGCDVDKPRNLAKSVTVE